MENNNYIEKTIFDESIEKVKVKRKIFNKAAFSDALLLSFISGLFMGAIFLIMYSKII